MSCGHSYAVDIASFSCVSAGGWADPTGSGPSRVPTGCTRKSVRSKGDAEGRQSRARRLAQHMQNPLRTTARPGVRRSPRSRREPGDSATVAAAGAGDAYPGRDREINVMAEHEDQRTLESSGAADVMTAAPLTCPTFTTAPEAVM